MYYRSIEIRPASSALGAEIYGVDIAKNTSEEQFAEIRQAFYEFGVIFFRDQQLTPKQHVAFARRWGEINVNRFFKAVEGHPMVAEVRKEKDQSDNIGGNWHTDHSYDIAPAMGSILYACDVPESGGDTLFASMYSAYDALSVGLKKMLSNLKAVHSSRHVFGASASRLHGSDLTGRVGSAELATQDAVHPVIITHPHSGRKALYVNPVFTLGFHGWTEEESRPLLEFLYRHATRPEFTCRFCWQKGSVAFWDNRVTWHYALNDYQGERRLMHRVTVEGVPLN